MFKALFAQTGADICNSNKRERNKAVFHSSGQQSLMQIMWKEGNLLRFYQGD